MLGECLPLVKPCGRTAKRSLLLAAGEFHEGTLAASKAFWMCCRSCWGTIAGLSEDGCGKSQILRKTTQGVIACPCQCWSLHI